MDGTIPPEMSVEEAFASHPEFADYDGERLFPNRLEAVRKQHEKVKSRSKVEMEALLHDRQIHPRPTTNFHGEPQWEGSRAQRLLMKDILTHEKHKSMTPAEIFASRDEYCAFNKDRFRDRIYQIQRTDKFKKQMQDKAEAKAAKAAAKAARKR